MKTKAERLGWSKPNPEKPKHLILQALEGKRISPEEWERRNRNNKTLLVP